MHVGFTGTRAGMSDAQRGVIARLMEHYSFGHHGDCIGADEDFHDLCIRLGLAVIIHPPDDPKQRAFCEGAETVWDPEPYLRRNQRIVRVTALLIAAPKEWSEPAPARGQGTWSTVRYARKRASGAVVVFPDGRIERSDAG